MNLLDGLERKRASIDNYLAGVELIEKLLSIQFYYDGSYKDALRNLSDKEISPPTLKDSSGAVCGYLYRSLCDDALIQHGQEASSNPIYPIDPEQLSVMAGIRGNHVLDSVKHRATPYLECDDQSLIDEYFSNFKFESADLLSLANMDSGCIFHKINHGYWEYLLFLALGDQYPAERLRKTNISPFVDRLQYSGFINLLYFLQSHLDTDAESLRNYFYAVSYSAGVNPIVGCRPKKITDVARGAMIGALTYHEQLPKGSIQRVYDGYAVKRLCYENTLSDFCDILSEKSDAVLFIVPQTISNIRLKKRRCDEYVLAVPRHHVHHHWPAVAALVLGTVRELLGTHSKLSILMQSGAASAMLSNLLERYARGIPESPSRWLKCFDLGRVLDSANSTAIESQAWLKGKGAYWDVPFELA